MGKRGPGAARQRLASEALPARKRWLPWKKKGLTKAQQVIAFLEWLPVTKGIRLGKKMKLIPPQRDFINSVFAADAKGNLKISLAILSQAKGNGKTGLIAGICAAALLGPLSEERGAIYSASISKKKASAIFDELKAIVLKVPEFACRVNIVDFHKEMRVLEGDGLDSTYEALSAEHAGAQGLAPTLWLYDEFGEARDGKLLQNLLESHGKRNHTLGIVLSTQADSDDHPFSKLIDDALTGADPRTHIQIHTVPETMDAFSDEAILLANPAAGHFLDLVEIHSARDRAKRMPSLEAGYRRLRLNQRADSNPEDRLVNVAVWKANAGTADRIKLKGRPCFGGLDLSGKHDLTALVLVFPSDGLDPSFDILPFFWTPAGQLPHRTEAEAERFKAWISQGQMIEVPGPTIRYSFVAKQLAKLASEFDIKSIGFDRYRIDDLKVELDDIECTLPLEPFGQGFVSMGPAIERFADLALSAKLSHAGHPVLTAAVANAITVSDPAGNLKIDKDKSNGRGPVRIDGAVAMVMALQVANRFEPPPTKPTLKGFLKKPIMVI